MSSLSSLWLRLILSPRLLCRHHHNRGDQIKRKQNDQSDDIHSDGVDSDHNDNNDEDDNDDDEDDDVDEDTNDGLDDNEEERDPPPLAVQEPVSFLLNSTSASNSYGSCSPRLLSDFIAFAGFLSLTRLSVRTSTFSFSVASILCP